MEPSEAGQFTPNQPGIIQRKEKRPNSMVKSLAPLLALNAVALNFIGILLILTCVGAPIGIVLMVLAGAGPEALKDGVYYDVQCPVCGQKTARVFRGSHEESAVLKCFKCKTRLRVRDSDGVKPIQEVLNADNSDETGKQ